MKRPGRAQQSVPAGSYICTTGVVEFSRMKICPCFWGEKSTQINLNFKIPKSINFLGKESLAGTQNVCQWCHKQSIEVGLRLHSAAKLSQIL